MKRQALAPSADSPGRTGSGDPARILVVEDDATMSELLAYNLRRAGYEVLQAGDGRRGLEIALRENVQLVLMDILLPGLDGMSASREILRAKPQLPVIMLSAVHDRERLLQGFALGADDYITKPFDLDILLARISASLRRSAAKPVTTPESRPRPSVSVKGLVLDSDSRSLRGSGREVSLTPKEFDLLKLLMSQPGHLFSKQEITEAVWHHRYLSTSRTLDAHMRRLRRKLQLVEAPMTVQVVRRVGYRLAPKPEQAC